MIERAREVPDAAGRPSHDARKLKAATRLNSRRLWLDVHSYLALVLGAFVALTALTGAAVTFRAELDRLVYPQLRIEPRGVPHLFIDDVVASVEASGPEVALVRMPRPREPYYTVEYRDPQNGAYRFSRLDPESGELLTDQPWGGDLPALLVSLHTGAIAGTIGFKFVGWMGVVLLISTVTGIYLWWPRGHAGWWRALTLRWSRRAHALNFELHRISGVYLAAIVIVLCVSGICIVFPSVAEPVVGLFGSVQGAGDAPRSTPAQPGVQPLSLERVREIVHVHSPGSHVASIILPRDAHGAFAVWYVDRGEPDNRSGQSTAWIDQYSGKLLDSRPYGQMSAPQRFLALQLPLHTGEILGLPGQLLVCLAGLATCLLYCTGLYLWWKRRTRRRAGTQQR